MAFTNFYLIAGGAGSADINAGSTIGAAQAAATTNGSWNSGTGVFIAASGTPFAATTTNDYASVYVDGATVTTFVGKVTTVTSSTQITVDVATIKYGTAPSTSANGRSCVINGSWNTEQVLAAGGLATTTAPQSTKINIKGNLTITASRTISMAGATTTPLWFSGYNTTPGDLDNDTTNSLAKPVWTQNATFTLAFSGAQVLITGLSFAGSRSGTIFTVNNSTARIQRCRFENTSSNAAAVALTVSNAGSVTYSWCKCPTSASTTGVIASQANACHFVGVVSDGGAPGFNSSNLAPIFISCISINSAGVGFLASTGSPAYFGCTVYNATSDGIQWSGTPPGSSGVHCAVIGCLFNVCGGYGINNASGTNSNNVFRACNDFYSVTSGAENGFGDSPDFFRQTDAGSGAPGMVVSATDMTPIPTSNAINHGFPGIFENQTYSSYPPIGAVTPLASGGSAVAIFGS